MRFLRAAEDDIDGPDLAAFRCADRTKRHEADVEDFVCAALVWRNAPGGDDREVLLLDDDGDVLGVVAHENDDGDRFVNAVAVRCDRHGEGLGKEILGSLLYDLSQHMPGLTASWLVHPANFPSHGMSNALGAEPTWPPEDRPFTRYSIGL